jgi:hypothetical protein
MRTSQTRFPSASLRASAHRFGLRPLLVLYVHLADSFPFGSPSASLGAAAHQGLGPEFPLVFKRDKSGFRRSSPGRQTPAAHAAQQPAIAAADH